ncbi:MAG: hypothetical protein EXQ56_00940 [Acidobacteria bacterium]|nr:hypothetical protein [Acidobacteriota bacterium]
MFGLMMKKLFLIGTMLLLVGAMDGLLAQAPALPNPLVTGQAASIVVGQRNFSDITFGNTPDRWGAVSGMAIAGNRLIVADSSYLAPPNNNRVLIYNNLALIKQRLPQGNLPNADIVLGQARPDTTTPGTSATLMNQPVGVATDGTRLFISEWGNNRILIYNRIPTEEGVPADVVIGQANFTTSAFAAGANRLRRPNSVASDGRRVFIADTLNNRVLIYNSIPTQNGANADVVLGQANFDNFGRSPAAANRTYDPMSVTTDGTRLIVTDFGNNRVLIYNSIPTQSGASADVVVGQLDFTGAEPGNTASTLNFPRYAFSDGTRLLIVDSGNNRVLIYNRIPTANGAVADLVIGQQDFTGLFESCAASYFAVPYAAGSDGDTLFVADSFNRRVLGFRPGAPLISSVVNAASFSARAQTAACSVILPQPPVAPGGLAAVMGANLADSSIESKDLPMAYELGGVSVKVNGIPAPVYFVSPGQVNIQIPFEVTGYSASIEVTRRTGNTSITSAAAPLGLANGAPGIFTVDGKADGNGPGLITHANLTPVTEANPAKKGEILIANVTGLGTVDHPVVNGVAAQFGAEGTITVNGVVAEGQTVTVTINGRTYSYTARKDDTLTLVNSGLAALINANDPDVKATANEAEGGIALRAIVYGDQGTNITYSASGADGSSLNATTAGSLSLPASFSFSGTPVPGQTVLFTFAQTSYTYTVVAGDTAADVLRKIAADIDSDPNIAVGVDLANLSMRLVLEDENLNIPFRSSLSDAGTSIVIIAGTFSSVPGSLTFAGPVTPGQTVTIVMQSTQYPYTTVAGDTLETLVTRLAALVNADTNVSATADTAKKSIAFALKTPNLNISFSAFVRLAAAFQADTGGVGVAPATLALRGNPSTGQTVRAFVGTRIYSYTVVAGDTLGTIATRLAGLINVDPKVSATADSAAGTISIALREEPKLLVPGSITFSGALTGGHVLTLQLGGVSYTYTVVSNDTLQTLVTKFSQVINADLNVAAVADTITNRILLSRRNPTLTDAIEFRLILPSGSTLTVVTTSADQTPVSISIGGTQPFQLLTEGNRLTAGDAQATNTVSATIGEALNVVPGTIFFGGTPVPGEILTVRLLETVYQYTVSASDTLQSMVTNFAQVISTDPNVSATADTVNNRINVALKNPTSNSQISFRLIVPTASTLLGITDSATTTGSTGTSVSFAGLLKGSVGVYQVYFTVPTDAAPNPLTKFSLQQNLIILGSVSEFDIVSNTVTFPVGE